MKASAVALAVILLSLVSAHAITTSTQAFAYVIDAGGNVGLVYVFRQTDPTTNLTTTTLSYSFCVQTVAASCLEGSGVIPNSAFAGTLDGNSNRAEVVKLLADTTIQGFANNLCNAPDEFGECTLGTSPATGGPISLGFVTKKGFVEVFTFNDYKRENFKITINATDQTSQGPASVQGTVLGTSVNNPGASWGISTVSGKGSPGSQARKAQSHLTLEKSITPQALRRLQRLRGETPAE